MHESASKNVVNYGQYQFITSAISAWGVLVYMYADLTIGIWFVHILVASIIHMIGVKINGHWRWSPFVRLIGSSINAVFFCLFIGGYTIEQFGPLEVAFGSGFAIMYIWFIMLNIGDTVRAVKKW